MHTPYITTTEPQTSCLWCKYYNKRGFCTDDYGYLTTKEIEDRVQMGARTIGLPPNLVRCANWVSKINLQKVKCKDCHYLSHDNFRCCKPYGGRFVVSPEDNICKDFKKNQ